MVWCRNRMNYNNFLCCERFPCVVVWCRNRMNYNPEGVGRCLHSWLWFDVEIEWITTLAKFFVTLISLWFDVEIEWITTSQAIANTVLKLWFDVEIEWITTCEQINHIYSQLWFDVEIEWITTLMLLYGRVERCGLM